MTDTATHTATATHTGTAPAAVTHTAPAAEAPVAGGTAAAAPAATTTTATTSAAMTVHAAGGDPAASTEAVIAGHRVRIDDLDARIIGLVRERVEVSRRIQAARMGAGGRRVHLAREMEILRAYGDALGRPGTSVAMALLELCRGTA